jgi:outer membrane lipase/esterase
MVTRIGYQLMGGSADGIRPYLRVAHNDESEDGTIFVNAGSNSMNGRFTMAGYTPSQDWISADLGLNWAIGESTTAFAAYNGRFGDNNEDSNSFSLGLRMTF